MLIVVGIYINFRKVMLVLFIIILVINLATLYTQGSKSRLTEFYPTSSHLVNPILSQFEIHAPINITSDNHFIELGFQGNGDQQSPYIIGGLSITGSVDIQKLINIENVNSHFIIQNNQLYGNGSEKVDPFNANYNVIQKIVNIRNVFSSFIIRNNNFLGNGSDGIKIQNTNPGTIENNHIKSTYRAIIVGNCELSIINNNISDTIYRGIYMSSSPGSDIFNNTIYNSGNDGINVYSTDVTIRNNLIEYANSVIIFNSFPIPAGISVNGPSNSINKLTVSDNIIIGAHHGIASQGYNSLFSNNEILNSKGNGIYIDHLYTSGSLGENTFSYNLIMNTSLHGIAIVSGSNNVFSNNEIINSGFSGISISGIGINYGNNNGANNNIFEHNNIYNSEDYGVRIGHFAENNSFINNNFMNNGNNSTQGYAESEINTIEYNYWNDWTGPDIDGNGIVDQPYEFENNSDKYPLIEPNSGEAFRPIQTQEIVQDPTENGLVNPIKRITTITETETIIPVRTVFNQRSYDIPSITLFIIFSFIGLMTIQGRNPVFNKIRDELRKIRKRTNRSISSSRPIQGQNMNLNIFCNTCGTTNPPLSSFCMECGKSQDV
ncbi:MAG: hypothetical protein HeimC2_00980 [Candidatus Heimdallarchaeota archaeon LC_2]|nr:MAG: hypothetical protein HeimC2_00980 [Candidatus Heimdallarchaeota archaeon LC_2]